MLARHALILLYMLLLFISYRHLTVPKWGYLGFTDYGPHAADVATSFLLVLGVSGLLPEKSNAPSGLAAWVLFLVVIAPLGAIGPMANSSMTTVGSVVTAQICLPFALFVVFVRSARHRRIEIGIPRCKNLTSFLLLAVACSLVLGIVVGSSYGFQLRPSVAFDNLSVREIRQSTRELGTPLLASYARNWLGKVLGPLLFGLALLYFQRRRTATALAIGALASTLQVLSFSAAANVSLLFAPAAVLAMAVIVRSRRMTLGYGLLASAIAIVSSSALLFAAGMPWLFDNIARRMLHTSPILTHRYLDFFRHRESAFFQDFSFGGAFGPRRYDDLIPRIVGSEYGFPEGTHANVNVFADAYAQAGALGPTVFAIMLIYIFRLLDGLAVGQSSVISAAVLVMPAWSLADTGLISAILSHGVLVATLLIAVAPAAIPLQPNARAGVASPAAAGGPRAL